MKQETFLIKSNKEIAPHVYEMHLEGDTSSLHAGQFVNIAIDGLYLRRPISVCDAEGNDVTLLYKEIGKGIIEQGDKMAAAYKNATLVVERLKRSMDATFNQKQSELSADLWARYFGDATEVSKKELIQVYEDIAKLNKQAAIDSGWT